MDKLTVKELRVILRKSSLPTTGTKQVLIKRINDKNSLKQKIVKTVVNNKKEILSFGALVGLGFTMYKNKEDLKNITPEKLSEMLDKVIGMENRKKIQETIKNLLQITTAQSKSIVDIILNLRNKSKDALVNLKNTIIGLYQGNKIKTALALNGLLNAIGFTFAEKTALVKEYYNKVKNTEQGLAKLLAVREFALTLLSKIEAKVKNVVPAQMNKLMINERKSSEYFTPMNSPYPFETNLP